MKFRIKYVAEDENYYSQVKIFIFWFKIGKHTTGFGLYDEDDLEHPMKTPEEAVRRCEDYFKWKTNKPYSSYQHLEIN